MNQSAPDPAALAAPPRIPPSPSVPERKSIRVRVALWTTTCAVLLLIGISASHFLPSSHARQITCINSLSSLRFPSQLPRGQRLCTPAGSKLLPLLVLDSGELCLAHFKAVGFKSNPGWCDVEMVQDSADGVSRVYVHLVDQHGWKFDDLKIEQANDNEIGLWASDIVANPNLLTEKLIVAKIGKVWRSTVSAADDFGRILDVFEKFKRALDPQDGQRQSDQAQIDPLLY